MATNNLILNNLILNVEDITGIIAEITDLAPGEGLISTIVADTGTITFADSDIYLTRS